ncbi:phosphate transport system regulatory protein PhoU [Pseudonocardia asaccharolytica DSM 44247 = NBRC 16224]|uniref:Phosphate transport system regulatory protein PhoU n=2 Tax=Pseudonocardia asaccharolytica TaxID=54010 RepID=A0A511D5I1_9PSEU|nr:phosphate transport system regulatory protein PhoU [Pseudonocardia asaccharolytica DSM 44247 = NBRC 16224]
MATAVATAMQKATTALLQGRVRLAEHVIADEPTLDALRAQTEKVAVIALALRQPVATDLRRIVSIIRVAGDLERMGDLAEHIAKSARRRHPDLAVPEEVRPLLQQMGDIAVALALKVAEALRTRDLILAAELETDDDAMDDLHRQVFQVLLGPEWQHDVSAAVDLTLLARYYERFADRAVAVGRRMT